MSDEAPETAEHIVTAHRHTGIEDENGNVWTLEAFIVHASTLRTADQRFYEERDRRYAEVNIEKEKALKIKEMADANALQLAREIQIYKDEKANELRSQIERERVTYASKDDIKSLAEKIDLAIKPLDNYVASQHGQSQGFSTTGTILASVIPIGISLVGVAVAITVLVTR